MANDAYLDALQALLVELSTVQGKIDAAQPRPAQQPQAAPAPAPAPASPPQVELRQLESPR
jgi:hypothetical protein